MVVLMIPNSCNAVPTHNERRSSVYNDDFEYIPVVKPIRVLQFLLTSGILALTIYTILNESPYTESIKILLILVFGTYAFIALIDIISQLSGDPIPDTPMFLFGVVGIVLFLLAAFQIFNNTRRNDTKEPWRVTMTMALSMIASLLYLTDVLLIFLYGY